MTAESDRYWRATKANPETISKRNYRKLQRVLHPDANLSEKAKTEAFQIFGALKIDVIDEPKS